MEERECSSSSPDNNPRERWRGGMSGSVGLGKKNPPSPTRSHYETVGLRRILTTFSDLNSQCENPRDKVYGLLGLLPREARIQVRYDKTIGKVCQDVIRKIVELEPWSLRSFFLDFAKSLKRMFDLPDLDIERMLDDELARQGGSLMSI